MNDYYIQLRLSQYCYIIKNPGYFDMKPVPLQVNYFPYFYSLGELWFLRIQHQEKIISSEVFMEINRVVKARRVIIGNLKIKTDKISL